MSGDQPLALVVGGSGAIGAAVMDVLLGLGYAIVATHRRPDEPGGWSGKVTWARFDTADRDCPALDEALSGDLRPLQIVVYAVGTPSSKATVADTDVSEWEELFAVNALGLALVWRIVAKRARRAQARMVVISSQATRTISAGSGPYSASKAALEAIALTLAKEEYPAGVRVNVVSPSLVDSPQARQVLARIGVADSAKHYRGLPWRRALQPSEVAGVVASLAHDPDWAYATGQVFQLGARLSPGALS